MKSVQQLRPNAMERNGVLAHTQAYSIYILGQQNWGCRCSQFGSLLHLNLPSTHLGHTPDMPRAAMVYNPKCATALFYPQIRATELGMRV